MFWIIIFNFAFFIGNLVIAVKATSIEWAVFSGFCSGVCFAMFFVSAIMYTGFSPND